MAAKKTAVVVEDTAGLVNVYAVDSVEPLPGGVYALRDRQYEFTVKAQDVKLIGDASESLLSRLRPHPPPNPIQ